MNPLVEQYVRHAKRFGDPQSVYRTAARDRLSATELGYLAARLARLDPEREANQFWESRHRRGRSPKFRLSREQKLKLARRLLNEGVAVKTVATYVQASTRWVLELQSDLEAELALARIIGVPEVDDPGAIELARRAGVDQGGGIGPVDLLDAATDGSLYRALTTILGYASSSPESTPDRLSTSGIGGDIVTAGLRFERLTVVRLERDKSGRKVAVCRCDCGAETTAKPSHLVRGEKRSCGCLRRERMAAIRNRPEVSA